MLELAFATKDLRALCEDEDLAVAQLGHEVAKSLRHRLADLRAAIHPLDLPMCGARLGTGVDAKHVMIELAGGYQLVFRANHPHPPQTDDGDIAWDRVSRILFLRIEAPSE